MKLETSREEIYKQQIRLLTYMLAVMAIIIGVLIGMVIDVRGEVVEEVAEEIVQEVEVVEVVETPSTPTLIEREVVFTNYYTGDRCGSTAKTGSGLTTDQFKVNELGFYTYNNKVVVASATYQGLNSSYGVLERYSEPLDGITYHNYFDTLELKIGGVAYEAIVLDTVGAGMELQPSDNGLQRYDIFIAGKEYAFGKVRGVILE